MLRKPKSPSVNHLRGCLGFATNHGWPLESTRNLVGQNPQLVNAKSPHLTASTCINIHHHSRVSHILSPALIASSSASVVLCYSFLPSASAHHLVRGTWKRKAITGGLSYSKASMQCSSTSSSRSSMEEPQGFRKIVQQAWIVLIQGR